MDFLMLSDVSSINACNIAMALFGRQREFIGVMFRGLDYSCLKGYLWQLGVSPL